MGDLIDRQAAIDADGLDEEIRCEMCKNPMHTDRGCDGNCKYDEILYEKIIQILNKRITPLPSAQPEIEERKEESVQNVPDSDLISRKAAIDAINNAFDRETLLRGFVRSIALRAIRDMPSAQPEIIRCKDCMYWVAHDKWCVYMNHGFAPNMWCCHGERRTDEGD